MKTQQQKQEERRKEKLALMEQQVKDGSLVVRKMTATERKKYPARSPGKATGRPRGARGRRPAAKREMSYPQTL